MKKTQLPGLSVLARKFTDVVLGVAVLAVAACSPGGGEAPGERVDAVRVVTSGGFSAAYNSLQEQAAEELGIVLETHYGASAGGSPNSIPERLGRGEQFDLIILSRPALDQLADAGYVRPASRQDLGRSRIGMAVREGDPAPDISSVEAFTQLLLDAQSIGYSASASGIYLSQELWPRMGLWEAIEDKSVRVVGERVAAVVARGDLEIGFQQVSEILSIPGAHYVGLIPEPLQRVTAFSAGVPVDAANPVDAQRLIDWFAAPAVAEQIRATGLDPVASGNAAQ